MSKMADSNIEEQQRQTEYPTAEWTRNKADDLAVRNGCYFDLTAAERIKDFIEKYIRVPARGNKSEPAHLLDWQWSNVVAPLFGWRRADGRRRFRTGYVSVAKKNGKTHLLSMIVLAVLVCEMVDGDSAFSVATQREQAGMIYDAAKRLIRASPELKAILEYNDSKKKITFGRKFTSYQALAAEAGGVEGANSSITIYDELHAARNRELYDALRYAGIARPDSLLLAITTAGDDPQSICFEQYQYAKKVNAGEIPDDSFYGFIAEADPKDDWSVEATWRKANPALGAHLSVADFKKDFEEARMSPAKENAFRRYRLNQWVQAESRFIAAEAWAANLDTYTEADLNGKSCFAGVDLSSTTDVTAVVYRFPFDDGSYRQFCRFYVPQARITAMRGRLPYDTWARQGFITAVPGDVIDYDVVRADIKADGKRFTIRGIGLDPYNAQNLETQLQGDGFKVFKVPQNMGTMSPLTKEYERQILQRHLLHNGNPVMTWMIGCTAVKGDAEGNIKPVKPDRFSTNKIDGVVADIMALGLATQEQRDANNPKLKSVYESRGLVVIGGDEEAAAEEIYA